ncbi:MAG: chemotaxis protein CheW [Mariprofundales bacterium]|nr:chemotaxis protein CheW [Mariprofundales bacterium]
MSAQPQTQDTEPEAASDGQLYITFELSGEMMAMPIKTVQEIVRPVEMAKVPMAPPHLLGVMALRGRMLPVSSTARVLGNEEKASDKDTRIIVLAQSDGTNFGLLVDRLTGVRQVADSDIEPAGDMNGNSRFISGMAKLDNGDEQVVAMLLDADSLSHPEEESRGAARREGGGSSGGGLQQEREEPEHVVVDDGEMRVIFGIGDEEYALGIKSVSEIISLTSSIAKLPQASAEIEGVTTLRGRVLSLIHGRVLFGLERTEITAGTKALEIEACGQRVGLIVDRVMAVTRVPDSQIEATPQLLRSGRIGSMIESICKFDGGRLVSNINAKGLIAQDVVTEAIQQAEAQKANGDEDTGLDDEEVVTVMEGESMQWVVFTLGGEEYAAKGEQIREIVRVPEIVTVPQAPDFVEGAIALRGRILPVINLSRRFGEEASEIHDDAKIIVAEMQGVATGVLVDGVRAVMDISEQDQQEAPGIVAGKNGMITGLAGLEGGKRIIMLLDLDRVLNADEFEALKEVSESEEVEA